jgi:hypothetical protein
MDIARVIQPSEARRPCVILVCLPLHLPRLIGRSIEPRDGDGADPIRPSPPSSPTEPQGIGSAFAVPPYRTEPNRSDEGWEGTQQQQQQQQHPQHPLRPVISSSGFIDALGAQAARRRQQWRRRGWQSNNGYAGVVVLTPTPMCRPRVGRRLQPAPSRGAMPPASNLLGSERRETTTSTYGARRQGRCATNGINTRQRNGLSTTNGCVGAPRAQPIQHRLLLLRFC